MTGRAEPPARRDGPDPLWRRLIEPLCLVAIALVPYLRAPGRVTSDTKLYLYLDPFEFLARVPYLWDRHVAAGTVSHQHVGYLFPMGPFFALAEAIGISDWLAQRLWLAAITALSGIGARWLFGRIGVGRAGSFAGALVYMLAPYQVAFSVRMSVLLLPFAALPWVLGLVWSGLERPSWREPAALALIAMTVGSVNLSALVLMGAGPLVVLACVRRAPGAAWRLSWRTALLTLATSAWWLNGLRIQGRYGLPILQLTENVATISEFSLPNDILRGLGNWFFYSREPDSTYSLAQAPGYAGNDLVLLATYSLPALALAASLWLRWNPRRAFVAMIVLATVIGTGAWPDSNPRFIGRVWERLTESSSVAAALRNTPRVVPVLVFAVAALLAASIAACERRGKALGAMATSVVVALAVVGFGPVWVHGVSSEPFERGPTPAYWSELAAALDAEGQTSRVFEIPGTNFSVYRWGNTIEPLLPGLAQRPTLAREVLPYGTVGTVDLLDAFERRMQLGTFEPASLAPVARLFGAGTIVVRNDLDYRRTISPRPELVWGVLSESRVEGLDEPVVFGESIPESLRLDPIALASDRDAIVPPAATIAVKDARPIVDVAPIEHATIVVGDGDGIVDAAASGLIDGRGLVVELGALDDAQLADWLAQGARVVLTDSNRKRYRNFFSSIAATVGPTEGADETLEDPYGYSERPDVFAHDEPADQSFVEQVGGRVRSTRDGGAGRPEDRAARAFDGDPMTAWRIDGAVVVGERIEVEVAVPIELSSLRLLQALDHPRDRRITEIAIVLDGATTIVTKLDEKSFAGDGVEIAFPTQTARTIAVEIRATTPTSGIARLANPVGFAEIGVGETRVIETLVVPDSLGRRTADGFTAPLDVVLTRQRVNPGILGRRDEESNLDRRFTLPADEEFELSGTLRVAANAPDSALDLALGSGLDGAHASSSSRLQGSATARAAMAFDGNTKTHWTSAFRPQEGEWIEVELGRGMRFDDLTLDVVADGRHQVPTRVRVAVDGKTVETVDLPAITDRDNARSVEVPIALRRAVTGRRLRLTIEAVRRSSSDPDPWLPVSLSVSGLVVADRPSAIDPGCRDDLLELDGRPLSIRALESDSASVVANGSQFESCEAVVDLAAGEHRIVSVAGSVRGIDIDRVVLRSIAPGAPAPASATTATVVADERDRLGVELVSDGQPFWLVLRESVSEGWEPSGAGLDFGPRTMIDGYANGWLVTPEGTGTFSMSLRWAPQRTQWLAFALSFVAAVGCVVLLVRSRRSPRPIDATAFGPAFDFSRPGSIPAEAPPTWSGGRIALLIGFVIATAAVSRPWVAALAVVSALAWQRRPTRVVLTIAIPLLVIGSRLFERPEWVWLALMWVALGLVLDRRRGTGDNCESPFASEPDGSPT